MITRLRNLISKIQPAKELKNSRLSSLIDYFCERAEVSNVILIGAENLKVINTYNEKYNYTLVDSQTKLDKVKFKGIKLTVENLNAISTEDLSNSIVISNCILSDVNKKQLLNVYKNWSTVCPLLLIVEKDSSRNKKGLMNLIEFEQEITAQGFPKSLSGFCNLHNSGIKDEFIIITGKYTIAHTNANNKRILAIISMFNEKDIIVESVKKLIKNGINVHVIDNWSKDGGFEKVVELSKTSKNITYERFPDKPEAEYKWGEILKRKQDIAQEMEFDWYLHCDADEVRQSPWSNNLAESITRIDSMGFNAIDLTVIDFRPILDGYSENDDPEKFFTYFEFGKRPGHFLQVKGWKANKDINLVDEGGHNASFPDRKIYPFKFLLKHYPLRSVNQGNTKIFKDRLPRVERIMKETGWHTHYKVLGDQNKFLWDKDELLKFSDDFDREYIVERLTGVGII